MSQHAVQRLLERHLLARAAILHPALPLLQLHRAGSRATWPHHDLPGMAHQVGIGELRTGTLVAIVKQGLAAEPGIDVVADTVARGITRTQVQDRDWNGATLAGQMMPASSCDGLDDRTHQARNSDAVAAHFRYDRRPVRAGHGELHLPTIFAAEIEDLPHLDAAPLALLVGSDTPPSAQYRASPRWRHSRC